MTDSRKRYSLDQCVLYCCRSKSKLFRLLGTDAHEICRLIENMDEQYRVFDLEKKDGGTRTVHGPSLRLKQIQKNYISILEKLRDQVGLSQEKQERA